MTNKRKSARLAHHAKSNVFDELNRGSSIVDREEDETNLMSIKNVPKSRTNHNESKANRQLSSKLRSSGKTWTNVWMIFMFLLLLFVLIGVGGVVCRRSLSQSSSSADVAADRRSASSNQATQRSTVTTKQSRQNEIQDDDDNDDDDDDDQLIVNNNHDDDDDDDDNDDEDDGNEDENQVDDDDDDVIEEINDAETLNQLIESNDHLLVFFYDKDDDRIANEATKILEKLETIDDDCDDYDIGFVKIDNDALAREFGLHDELPALVYFEHQMPSIYEGPYDRASSVLEWIVEQKSDDTIEEVTDEILERLIARNSYVLVFFAPNSCTNECEQILKGLETIDDDTDDHGILFVTTDDVELAKRRAKVSKFPALVLFRGGPTGDYKQFKGNLKDHKQILDWVLSEDTLDNPNVIETINRRMFEKMLHKSSHLLVLFSKSSTTDNSNAAPCKACDKSLATLEQIDHLLENKEVDVVRVTDLALAKQFNVNISQEPKLVYFKHRYPHVYQGSMVNSNADQIFKWVTNELDNDQDIIELVTGDMLDILLDHMDHLVVLFYDSKSSASAKVKKIFAELEKIDDDTDEHGIQFVKCEDLAWAKRHKLGLASDTLPALVYFERTKVPSIYHGDDLEDEQQVLQWLIEQKNDDTIENINREMLQHMIEQHDYVAAIFYKSQHKASEAALEQLEHIDDDVGQFDVHLVKINDEQFARQKFNIKQLPALVLFRQQQPLVYNQDLTSGNANIRSTVVDWLTSPDNLETGHAIELVNERMFDKFKRNTRYLAVLFYSSKRACKQCDQVLEAMESIDDEASEAGIRFIKVDSVELARKYNVKHLPSLVLFINDDDDEDHDDHRLNWYTGDMQNSEQILAWLSATKDNKTPNLKVATKSSAKASTGGVKKSSTRASSAAPKSASKSAKNVKKQSNSAPAKRRAHDVGVELVSGAQIRSIIESIEDDDDDNHDDDNDDEDEHLAVLVMPPGKQCDSVCTTALDTIQSIASQQYRELQQVQFVRTQDKSLARDFGLDTLPALVYFESDAESPTIYQGDLYRRDNVVKWLIEQTVEDTIEEVNRHILERLIENNDYLVVLFYKQHCKSCTTALELLELIDDDCDLFGIQMVKIQDISLAKRYGIKTFPALVYFRNGNPLIYDQDIKDEEDILEWLTSDEARDIDDEIESVNGRMLDKLIDSSPFLAVLFYTEQGTCNKCDEIIAELEKIDDDTDLYGIDFVKTTDSHAARKWRIKRFPTLVYFRKNTPSYYDGDLLDEESVLRWLTSSDAFELEDEIEEVNRRMLDKLLETHDYIAVYFYEKNCDKCERVIKELEHIDDEADSLDIMFVKIRDPNCAKKYGITHFPTLVYFRKKFPSIYRGDLMKEEKVLEWLRKNRYRNPELNLFMYAMFTITISFIFYTLFIMFCSKRKVE